MKALNAAPVRQAMFAGRKRWWNLLSYAPKDFTARLEPPPQPNFALLVIFVKKDQLSLFSVLLGSIKMILVVLLVISVLLAFIVRVEGLLIRLNALQAITVLLEQKEVPSIPAIMVLSATRLCLWLLLTANLAFLVCIVINVALYIRSINVQLVFTVEAGLLQGIRAIVENLVWTPPMPA